MKTEENRPSDSLNALKQLEQEFASSQTHDFLEDEIVIPVQHMFPNCRKYTKCCYDDKEFWNKVEEKQADLKEEKVIKGMVEKSHELILHNVNGFRINKRRDKIEETPEDFEGW